MRIHDESEIADLRGSMADGYDAAVVPVWQVLWASR